VAVNLRWVVRLGSAQPPSSVSDRSHEPFGTAPRSCERPRPGLDGIVSEVEGPRFVAQKPAMSFRDDRPLGRSRDWARFS